MVTDADGRELVRLARKAVCYYLDNHTVLKTKKGGPMSGLFVTITSITKTGENLRGCIGFLEGYKRLYQSVIDASIAAATQDPRFMPVSREELSSIIFEVSVLTEPLSVVDKNHILIGRDGLVLHWKYGSGLLLPQVPVELGWDVDEYLRNLCHKAGAPIDVLKDPSSQLYQFQAEIFKECSPSGEIMRLGQYK